MRFLLCQTKNWPHGKASNLRLLLDTSTFLWANMQSSSLSTEAKSAISDPNAKLHVSVASVWEMQIKHTLGKLPLPGNAEQIARKYALTLDAEILSITLDDIGLLYALPSYHRDPFDRILAAQAKSQSLTIVSPDEIFALYPVDRIW